MPNLDKTPIQNYPKLFFAYLIILRNKLQSAIIKFDSIGIYKSPVAKNAIYSFSRENQATIDASAKRLVALVQKTIPTPTDDLYKDLRETQLELLEERFKFFLTKYGHIRPKIAADILIKTLSSMIEKDRIFPTKLLDPISTIYINFKAGDKNQSQIITTVF